MTARRLTAISAVFALACLALAGIELRAQGGAAPGAPAGTPAQGGGRRGGGGGGAAGGGAAGAAAQPGGGGRGGAQAKGTLTPLALDARGEGWMVKSYLDPKHLPLYNQAKQKLLDQKQVTSRTISRRDPE